MLSYGHLLVASQISQFEHPKTRKLDADYLLHYKYKQLRNDHFGIVIKLHRPMKNKAPLLKLVYEADLVKLLHEVDV